MKIDDDDIIFENNKKHHSIHESLIFLQNNLLFRENI